LAVVRQHVAAANAPSPDTIDGVHTLHWAFDRWNRAGGKTRADDVIGITRRHWQTFLTHCKLVMLSDVRRSHLLAWRDLLVESGKLRPKSINQRLQLVTAVLRQGWRDAEMAQPDLRALTVPEPDDSGRGAWSRDDILKALNALEPQSWQAWVYLLGLTTAARLGEPLAARRSWWNAKTGFIEVPPVDTKKEKPHAMPIIGCLRGSFEAYVAKRDEGFLFDAPRPKNPKVPISNVASKALNRLFDREGIDRVFHELRDTWIEEARHSPVKREMWEIISGHSGATVSDRYGGEKPDVLAEHNETICRFVTGDTEIMAAVCRLIA
jgi:integrase